MVCTAGQGRYSARLRRLRLCGRRDSNPGLRRDGRVRQIQQRTFRAPGDASSFLLGFARQRLVILEIKTNNEHLSLFINQLSDSVVDSDPEPLGFGLGSGIIVPDPDLIFFDNTFLLFLQIPYFKMV